eukprot:6343067-Alexandrium_andersonii.AAC.1
MRAHSAARPGPRCRALRRGAARRRRARGPQEEAQSKDVLGVPTPGHAGPESGAERLRRARRRDLARARALVQ